MTDWRMVPCQRKSLPAMMDDRGAAIQVYLRSQQLQSPGWYLAEDRIGKREKRERGGESRRRINRGLALFCRSAANFSDFVLTHILHHNYGSFTSNAAAGLPEIFIQDSRGNSASDQPPLHLDRLLATSQARPFPFEPPRTIPITNPSSPSTSKWYALQLNRMRLCRFC
jgi:hypothetical protein